MHYHPFSYAATPRHTTLPFLYRIVFKYLYSAPTQPKANRGAFGSICSKKKRQVLRSHKDVESLDDRREARAEGGRRFQREGAITAKDLDIRRLRTCTYVRMHVCMYMYECMHVCMCTYIHILMSIAGSLASMSPGESIPLGE